MSGYPYRLQVIWIAVLAFAWLGLCSPWSLGLNVLFAILVTVTTMVTMVLMTRRLHARYRATTQTLAAVDRTLRALPSDLKRHTPLVIAGGDLAAMAGAWGDDVVRITDAAIWVRGESPATVMYLADALKRWRGGQGPDAIALLIAADQCAADTAVASAWKPWRSAIHAAGRAVGYALPVCVAVYATAPRHDKDVCPWFGVSGAISLHTEALPAILASRLAPYVRAAAPTEPEAHARRAALLDALARWASATLLPVWTMGRAALHVTAFGVTTVPGVPASGAPFRQFVAQTTGLVSLSTDRRVLPRYPLPDALLTGSHVNRYAVRGRVRSFTL